MYAVGDQFNRAARRMDIKLEELGGERLIEVGLGDDQAAELYRGELDSWMEKLLPKLFGKESRERSYLDPPEPLFRLSVAVSVALSINVLRLRSSLKVVISRHGDLAWHSWSPV